LLDVSDRAEDEPKDGPLKLQLEYKAEEVVGPNWMERLCPELASNLNEGVRRKYATSSVRDCLRVIRNKKHHYHELPAATQRSLGSMPDGFYQYFAVRFPQLLLHAYACMASFVQLDPLASAPASSMGDAQFVKYYLHMSLGRHAQLRIKAGFACRGWLPSAEIFCDPPACQSLMQVTEESWAMGAKSVGAGVMKLTPITATPKAAVSTVGKGSESKAPEAISRDSSFNTKSNVSPSVGTNSRKQKRN